MNLGYADLWDSFNKQADEENWSPDERDKIRKKVKEGILAEIDELAELGVLRQT